MGWQVEQNTGVNALARVIRCVWFKGYIYAFTEEDGVWRRDGVGPWTRVFNGGGIGWYWPDDDALYCAGGATFGGNQIYRSTDGVTWVLDVDLAVAFGLQAAYSQWAAMGGYGPWFYVANWDAAGAPFRTYFYRRNLAGTWTTFGAPHIGQDGQEQKGIIQWGARVFWTTDLGAGGEVRYWDGAAWADDPTIDGLCGYPSHMSVTGSTLYVGASPALSPPGGWYWRNIGMTAWGFMPLDIPNATWSVHSLCRGADGEDYTLTHNNATHMRIYRRVGTSFSLVSSEAMFIGDIYSGVCVDDAGDMYFGNTTGAAICFFAYVPDYNLNPVGNGLIPQAMDVDGDGDVLYLGLYDATGNPELVRVNLPLDTDSMGSAMYQPGAGDAINVKCTNVGRNLVISGHFGANEQVRYSQDGGVTLTDMDPNNWAANRAQPLLVDPDAVEEVYVGLDAAQDLYETEDRGALWTQRNAAVGYAPGAMARLPDGPELVVGNGAGNRIDYSPYHGVSLHDITAGFVGNVAALEAV